jgi:phospholipid-binding lipoprotein MlaA
MRASGTEGLKIRHAFARLGAVLGLGIPLVIVAGGCATPERPDPLEPMNRGIFAFNETLDQYAIEPVAKGWDFIVPSVVQNSIQDFFDNLNMPIVFANDVLQAKPGAAGWDLVRFLFNSTFGIAGFIDVATIVEIPENDEDFGQTLGYWGVPTGPYLVIPILGPSTLRDGTGLIVDTAASSYAYFTPFWYGVAGLNGWETFGASVGVKAFELMNLRAIYLEEIAGSREDAFDYYVFLRNAYLQNRQARVLDQPEASADGEDLYYFDDAAGEDDEEYDDFDEEEDYDDY